MPTCAIFASLIFATTCIFFGSGSRMRTCRSRTCSPASMITSFVPRQPMILAYTTCPGSGALITHFSTWLSIRASCDMSNSWVALAALSRASAVLMSASN